MALLSLMSLLPDKLGESKPHGSVPGGIMKGCKDGRVMGRRRYLFLYCYVLLITPVRRVEVTDYLC